MVAGSVGTTEKTAGRGGVVGVGGPEQPVAEQLTQVGGGAGEVGGGGWRQSVSPGP
ncbi:hypothetical protein M2302_002589 [Micromonospora sp. A200]|uniref:hypothetical protein n=1 Tax=Micromonospora sp. A200 TaxID=2940568 RepID=UPI0024762079|nr:hypothetical protein [Micromonospora sp. A200]MDH6462409.1 hypothetical protein [Micromonospora sp. A200]